MRWALLIVPFVATSCCGEHRPAAISSSAWPVKSACTATSRSPGSAGLDVRLGRYHSNAQTLFVANVADEPRAVRVTQVSRVEGPCSGEWAGQTPINFVDADTDTAPGEVTVAPGRALELRIGDQRARGAWPCTKLGLAVWMDVGGEKVCADAGAWISERD